MDLTTQDIDFLMEAVKAWETAETANDLAGSLISSIFAPDKESAKREIEGFSERARKKSAVREERSIFIKAKLLTMKQALAVDSVFVEAGNVKP